MKVEVLILYVVNLFFSHSNLQSPPPYVPIQRRCLLSRHNAVTALFDNTLRASSTYEYVSSTPLSSEKRKSPLPSVPSQKNPLGSCTMDVIILKLLLPLPWNVFTTLKFLS